MEQRLELVNPSDEVRELAGGLAHEINKVAEHEHVMIESMKSPFVSIEFFILTLALMYKLARGKTITTDDISGLHDTEGNYFSILFKEPESDKPRSNLALINGVAKKLDEAIKKL